MTITILLILGLCFGSFINASVWRLHEQGKPKKKRLAADKDLSIVTGRSMCVHCQHTLAWYDMLPVVSWLTLGGRCRYCHQKIDDNPLVEVLTGLLFLLSYQAWPYGFSGANIILFVLWLGFLIGFAGLAVYDLKWMILPNRIVLPLQALAILYVAIQALIAPNPIQILEGALLGLIFSAGVFYLVFQLSHGKWIGGGDVKLAVVLGLLVGGPLNALLMLFVASLGGSLASIPLLLLGKMKRSSRLPFGPFLIMATIIVYLFGASLIAWYKRQLLIV